MDEVDLILHPLKSELNFPIGTKLDLDFHPLRWYVMLQRFIVGTPSPPSPIFYFLFFIFYFLFFIFIFIFYL
jgi:hypothetical protein